VIPRSTGLAGSVVVVTGASRALGAATARAFAENGAKVVVSGRDQSAIDEVVAGIRRDCGTAIGVRADVTNIDELRSLREETETELGPTDILLAFAGGGGESAPSLGLSAEGWRDAIDVNLTATFLTLQAFLLGMVERGHGSIVTMASAAARQPARSNVGYAAAKAGVIAMTRHLANELGPCGIRVNCIAPSGRQRAHERTDDRRRDHHSRKYISSKTRRPAVRRRRSGTLPRFGQRQLDHRRRPRRYRR
jgi:3-oxoacyl-[acyl-carrier protein] reductase